MAIPDFKERSQQPIYHMCKHAEWQAGAATGFYEGSSQDKADGFIHFSTAGQVRESAAKHRAGQTDLLLLTVDAALLGEALRWEEARNGQPFPHLYGKLPIEAVMAVDDLPLDDQGVHIFPVLAE